MSDLQSRLQEALGDVYYIGRALGCGGMSRVFVARETALGREVAAARSSSLRRYSIGTSCRCTWPRRSATSSTLLL